MLSSEKQQFFWFLTLVTCCSAKYSGFINQLTFTCSNSTTETLEKGVKYVQSQQ